MKNKKVKNQWQYKFYDFKDKKDMKICAIIGRRGMTRFNYMRLLIQKLKDEKEKC